MEGEISPTTPPSAVSSSSTEASQENDQPLANSGAPVSPAGSSGVKRQGVPSPSRMGGRKRGGGPQRGTSMKGRSKSRHGVGSWCGGAAACSSSKFVSPQAVLEAAREVKDKLPDVSPELLESLRNRGLEPVTLNEVLQERGLQWAATQIMDERASAEHARLLEAFQRQCEGWGNNREGWIHSKWKSVIVCPDFKRGGLQVSRSSMREMWNSIMSVVSGFVSPDLIICRVTDPTHPVRFATPPNESCFTVVYAGKEAIRPSKDRKILGEYTGHVRQGISNEQRFEYVFDLSFCAMAWRAAEEFEKESDSSGDEGPHDTVRPPPETSIHCETPKKRREGTATKGTECEGKRRVQVTGSQNIKRVALPVRGELVLDSHDACNQMSLVNHYGTIGLLGERICHVNTEWQQVFVDGWPHIVLTTIPGVGIEPGEEVLADFGYDWFNRVQDASHKAITRELLDYRIGARKGGCQTLAPARKAECVVRDCDASLQTRARMGEVCPYCHSDEILDVPPLPTKPAVKASQSSGGTVAPKGQDTGFDSTRGKPEESEPLRTINTAKPPPIWGEQVVHCDGCDRPCHLRCIFGAHNFDPQWQLQQQQEYEQHEQRQQEQEQELQEQKQLPAGDADAAVELPGEVTSNYEASQGDASADGCDAGDAATMGTSMDSAYRWFVEGDCKWYCCVCRLQWERMAAAMNFSVDWKAREILGAGNPLLLPTANDTAAKALRVCRMKEEQTSKESGTCAEASYSVSCGTKRRGLATKKAPTGNALNKRQKGNDASPHFTRSSKGIASASSEQDALQGAVRKTGVPESHGRDAETSCLVAEDKMESAASGVAQTAAVNGTAAAASRAFPGGETHEKCSLPSECPEGLQIEAKPALTSEGVAGLSTATPESPISGADSETQPKTLSGHFGAGLGGAIDSRIGDSEDSTAQGSASGGVHKGLAFQQVMRVYKNSAEKARTSKMQACPVAINPMELSREELLGCRTEMLVEPRALLGALQPCVRCYKLYGAKASVEVCRLTKRHLGSNWDHPDFTSPAQIQDALLSCFQDALLTVQRDHREKLQQLFDTMSPLQREVNMKALLSGNRYPRIHTNAARRSDANIQKEELKCTELVTKGVVPLLSVTLGKTRVDYQFPDPENKKKLKWFYGCVTDYQAVVNEVRSPEQHSNRTPADRRCRVKKDGEREEKITYYTNQFGIVYDDGDRQTVPPHQLIEMLIQTGPGSKLDGRKAITTTPLTKMLSPELKKANRQVNYLVRQTNRKGSSADLDSDSEED